jgi:YVTN family beta-propeller protein
MGTKFFGAALQVLGACSLSLALSTAWAGVSGVIYTANERDGSISEVQLDSGQVRTVKVDIAPHNVQVTPDGSTLLAVGVSAHSAHHGGGKSGQLLLLNTAKLDSPPVAVPAGDHPAHVVTDATGARAFVTDSGANVVRVIDLRQQTELAQIRTGTYPHGLRLSPDGRALYVANMKAGTVSVIDVATLQETRRIPVGQGPVQVGFSADGQQAYVSLSRENRLGLIDTAQQRLSSKVTVGHTPIQMMAAQDGTVYVANQGSAQAPSDQVSVVDPAKARAVTTLITGAGAHGVAASQDGAYMFVTNIEAGTLSVIDTVTRKVIAHHPVGAGPNGVSYLPPR